MPDKIHRSWTPEAERQNEPEHHDAAGSLPDSDPTRGERFTPEVLDSTALKLNCKFGFPAFCFVEESADNAVDVTGQLDALLVKDCNSASPYETEEEAHLKHDVLTSAKLVVLWIQQSGWWLFHQFGSNVVATCPVADAEALACSERHAFRRRLHQAAVGSREPEHAYSTRARSG